MFPTPFHWASDAQHHLQRSYGTWQQLLYKTPKAPAVLDVDGEPRGMKLITHTEEHSEATMAKRMRSVTVDFSVTLSGKSLLKRLKRHVPGKHVPPLSAAIDGASLTNHLAHLAHEPVGHETHFDTAFVVAIHLREVSLSGIARAAGPCSAQLLLKDCVFDKARGKIVPSSADRPTAWKAYLRPSGLRVDRTENKVATEVYALRVSPGVAERVGPGQVLLYSARTGLDTRLLLHMDAGSVGLSNLVVHYKGAAHVRAPVVDTADDGALTCPDSLSWFVTQAWARMYKADDFDRKLGKFQQVFARRDELDRFRQAVAAGDRFVPRSHLHEFDVKAEVKSDEAMVDKDHAIATVLPITPVEFSRACELFYKQVMRANRGLVDFTKGIRAVFEPFDCDAWRKHVQPEDEITATLSVDIVYVPLLNWLDTRVASELANGADKDTGDDDEDADVDVVGARDNDGDVEFDVEVVSEDDTEPPVNGGGGGVDAQNVL